jgi:hypothetical protein
LGRKEEVPLWAKEQYHARWAGIRQIETTESFPGVAVLRAGDLSKFEQGFDRLASAFGSLLAAPNQATVVLGFAGAKSPDPFRLADILRHLALPSGRVEVAFGADQLPGSVCEAFAKHLLLKERQVESKPSAPDPLAGARKVIAATKNLRAANGRLSAHAVAERFGLKPAQLAKVLGKTKQAVAQTPDAPSLQTGLRQFERVARLEAVLTHNEFRAWLNQPNQHLDGDAPIDLLMAGRAEVVVNLAESMLTGTPL